MAAKWKIFGFIIVIVLVVAGVAGYFLIAPQPTVKEVKPIKVGVIGPMEYTGGMQIKWGAIMAAEEINAKGGVLVGGVKRPIELVFADDKNDVKEGALAMEKLCTVEKVAMVTGGMKSEVVLAQQDVAMDYKVIFISSGSAHPQVAARVGENYDRYKYWFRVSPMNSTMLAHYFIQTLVITADKVRSELGIQKPKVAIVADKAIWTEPIIEAVNKRASDLGVEIVDVYLTHVHATDYSVELTKAKDAGAHILFVLLAHPSGIIFGKQWYELQIPAAICGVLIEAQKAGFWNATGGKANYITTSSDIWNKTWAKKFKERWGDDPFYTVHAYEAIYIWKEAVERAGTLDADAVVKELEKTKFKSISSVGYLAFSKWHDILTGPGWTEMGFVQWQDGKVKYVWPKNVAEAELLLPPWMIEYHKKVR